jgi:hypothetical protein
LSSGKAQINLVFRTFFRKFVASKVTKHISHDRTRDIQDESRGWLCGVPRGALPQERALPALESWSAAT